MNTKTIAATAIIALAAAASLSSATPASAGPATKAHQTSQKIFGADAGFLGVWAAGAPLHEAGR